MTSTHGGPNLDFSTQEIVSIKYVNSAILEVAFDLHEAVQTGHGLSAKHVRDVLRKAKQYYEATLRLHKSRHATSL